MKVKDLKDQIGTIGPRPSLHCFECDRSISANRGDYFMQSPDFEFFCCNELMSLVVEKTVYEVIE